MERYDYEAAVKRDIIDYIRENVKYDSYDELMDMEDYLYDELWIADSVTGNASGSYTFSRWQAEENLCHNLDLLGEAVHEWGAEDVLKSGPEAADVLLRCYLLEYVLSEVIEELGEEMDEREANA